MGHISVFSWSRMTKLSQSKAMHITAFTETSNNLDAPSGPTVISMLFNSKILNAMGGTCKLSVAGLKQRELLRGARGLTSRKPARPLRCMLP